MLCRKTLPEQINQCLDLEMLPLVAGALSGGQFSLKYGVLGVKRKTMLDRVNVTRCAIHFATILILQVEFLKSVQTVLKWSQFFFM